MSTSIDNRVVGLQFDNKNFEKNVSQTLNSLDQLENSLRLKGAGKGLEQIDKAASRIDFSRMGHAAELITKRLSTMGLVGINVLNRISNKAISAAENLLRAFTIQPPREGFAEYELKMGSVQTIVASTGESLGTVNAYLEELNRYSDKTIYSFKDMTSSIGKFTNAGVPLEKAVLAIQGISNEAAVSGANAEEASRAMYNFSQALSSGAVKLIDWKSIENANMATREFKQELINTAVAMGTLKKANDGMYKAGNVTMNATKNFNDSLQKQWMTSEVLIETLGRYADETTGIGKKAFAAAQDIKTYHQLLDTIKESIGSGWAQISEIIFGDLDEAKKLWTSIGNAMSNFVDNAFGGVITFLKNNLQSNYKSFLENGPLTDIEKFNKDYQAAVDEQRKPIQDEINANNEIIQSREMALNEWDKYTQRLKEKEKNGGWFLNDKGQKQSWLPEPRAIEHTASEVANLVSRNEELEKQMADNTIQSNVFKDTLLKQFDDTSSRMRGLLDAGHSFEEALKKMDISKEQYQNMMDWRRGIREGTIDIEALVASFDEVSRREKIFKALGNTFKAVGAIIKPVTNAFKNIFFNADKDELWLGKLIDGWEKWTEKLILSDEQIAAVTKSFEKMFGWIKNLGDWALPKLKSVGKKVVGVIEAAAISTYHFISAAIDFINPTQLMSDAYQWLSKKAHDAKEAIKELFNDLKKKPNVGPVLTALQSIYDKFNFILDNDIVTDNGEVLTKGYQKFWYVLRNLPEIFSEAFSEAGVTIEGFVEDIKQSFSDLSKDSETAFSDIYENISEFVSNVKEKAIEVGDWFKDNIGIIISGAYVTLMAYRLLKFVAFLDNILNSVDDFVKIIDRIPRAVSNAIKKLSSAAAFKMRAEGIKAFAEALLKVAEAIGIISLSIGLLSKLDTDSMWQGVGIILGITSLLVVLSATISKFGSAKGALSLGAIAGALMAVVFAADMITKIEVPDGKTILSTMVLIISVIVMVGGMLFAISKLKTDSMDSVKASVSITLAILALYGVILAVKMLSSMTLSGKDLVKGLARLGSALLLLLAIMAVLRVGGAHAGKAGLGLLAMTGALLMMLLIFSIIKKMDAQTIVKGVLSLMLIFTSLTICMAAVRIAGEEAHKAGFAILAIGLAILPLTLAVKLLSEMNGVKAAKGVGLLLGIMVSLGLVFALSRHYDASFRSLMGMIAVIAALGVIVGGLAMLTKFVGIKNMAAGVISFVSVLLSLGIAFKLMSKYTSSSWSGIGKFAVQLIIMGAIVAGLTAVVYGLSKIENPDTAVKMAVVLGGLLLELTFVMSICSLLGTVSSVALPGLLVLLGVLAVCGIVVAAAAGLGQIEGASEFIDKGIEILNKIGQGIGAFVGGIYEGIMDSALSMSETFVPFCENIKTALDSIGDVPENVGDTVVSISKAILILAAADVLDAIKNFLNLGQNTDTLPDKMASLGKAIKSMATELDGVDRATVSKVKLAAEASAELLPVVKQLSDKSFWTGENKLDVSKLTTFGEGITAFAASLSGIASDEVNINTDKISDIATAGTDLADMASAIPDGGGKIAEWFGDNKLDTFGEDLKKFAGAISELPDTTSKSGIIKQLAADGKELADMADDIPDLGGKWDEVFGTSSAEEFGKDIKGFADAINEVPALTVTTQTFDDLASIGTKLTDMANTIPEIGGMWQAIMGKTDAKTFGENMADYAKAMNTISGTVISTLSFYQLKDATDILNTILETINGMDITNLYAKLYDYEFIISDFINWVDGFSDRVDGKSVILDSIGELMSTAVKVLDNNLPKVKTQGLTFVKYYASGITSNLYFAVSAAKRVASRSTSALSNYSNAYTTGANVVQGFIDGLKSNFSGVYNAAFEVGQKAIHGLNDGTNSHSPSRYAKETGKFVDLGFALGMEEYSKKVDESARDVGKTSIQALSDSIADIATVLNSDMDLQPTIRPVLDLSEVQNEAKDLDSIYNSSQVRGISTGINSIRNAKNEVSSVNPSDSGVTVSYVQNNYSPKALSRIDIYRQTKNQISTMKGIVTTV